MAAVELEGWAELSKMLDRIDDTLTTRTKKDAVKAGGEVIARAARQLCPAGDPSHNQNAKPLRDTIAVEVKEYGPRALVVVGPQWPAGAHGHLVEYGHEIVARGPSRAGRKQKRQPGKRTGRRAIPKPFLRPAFDSTHTQQMAAMEQVIKQTLRELGAT